MIWEVWGRLLAAREEAAAAVQFAKGENWRLAPARAGHLAARMANSAGSVGQNTAEEDGARRTMLRSASEGAAAAALCAAGGRLREGEGGGGGQADGVHDVTWQQR
jgi:hypothetical protein